MVGTFSINTISLLEDAVQKLISMALPFRSLIWLLHGNLGSGKTEMVRQLTKLLDINENVSSPSFNLHHIYYGHLPAKEPVEIHHFDLYRLAGEPFDLLDPDQFNEKFILCVEWPERADIDWYDLGEKVFDIRLEYHPGTNERSLAYKIYESNVN